MSENIYNNPKEIEDKRKVILKGNVYEYGGIYVMAEETTCNLTKNYYKGICVRIDMHIATNINVVVGHRSKFDINVYNK